MRRLLTMTVVATTLVGVTSDAAVAGGELWHFELHQVPGGAVEPTTETEPLPVEWTDPVPAEAAKPVQFDSLWLAIVGLVGLLLVIRTVFTESRWPRHPASDQISRNGSGPRDVLTDE